MFRNKNLATSKQIIDSLLESGQIKKREGSIVFSKKEGRKTTAVGKLYLRDELIYAVSINNKDTPIGKRVATGGLVPMDDLQRIIHRTKNNPSSPEIVDLLLQNHLINEKAILLYVKEQSIDQIKEIFSWENVLGEWHPMTNTKEFMIPYVSFQKMRELIDKQTALTHEFFHLTEKFFRKEEMDSLTFTLTQNGLGEVSHETQVVSTFCDNKHTIAAIAEKTGLTEYKVFQTLMLLWKNHLVVIHLGAIQVPFSSVLAAQKFTLGAKTAEDIESGIPLININVPVTTHVQTQVSAAVEFEEVDEELSDEEPILQADTVTPVFTIEEVMADITQDEEQTPVVIEESETMQTDAHLNENISTSDINEQAITEDPLEVLLSGHNEVSAGVIGNNNETVPTNEATVIEELTGDVTTDFTPEVDSTENLVTENIEEQTIEALTDEEAEADDSFLLFTQMLEQIQHDLDQITDEWDTAKHETEALELEHDNLVEQLTKLANRLEKAQANEASVKLKHDDIYEQLQTTINSFTFTDVGDV